VAAGLETNLVARRFRATNRRAVGQLKQALRQSLLLSRMALPAAQGR
jgi:hypothetical protein